MRLTVLLIASLAVFFSSYALGQTPEEVCSIFEGTFANCKLWRNGDFVVKEEILLDNVVVKPTSVKGLVLSHFITRRVAFDFDARKYAVLVLDERSTSDFTNSNGDPVVTKKLSGWSVDLNGKSVKFDNGKVTEHVFATKDDGEILNLIGFFDLRGFWYRGISNNLEFNKVERIFDKYKAGLGYRSRKQVGVNEKLTFDQYSPPEIGTIKEVFTFDIQSLMIKSRVISGESVAGKPLGGPSAEVDWKAIDGVNVPVKGRFEDYVTIRLGNHEHKGLEQRNYTIDWVSLNGELDPTLFDGRCLKDANVLLEYFEPETKKFLD